MIIPKNSVGFDVLKSFQLGGAINVTEEKKKELFPYFAYIYSQQMNPEKYGSVTSIEEWTSLIQESKEDVDAITAAAAKLSNDEWDKLDQQYTEAQTQSNTSMQPQLAAKGAKLQELKETTKVVSQPILAKGGKPKKRKCSCGCDMILSKAAGGKVIETCSCKCGGKMKKKKK